jgi:hypothetical protein
MDQPVREIEELMFELDFEAYGADEDLTQLHAPSPDFAHPTKFRRLECEEGDIPIGEVDKYE